MSAAEKPDIVCIGELLVDFVPEKPGCSLREAEKFIRFPGGAPGNVAAGFSRLGGKAAFMGKVGRDEFGRFLIDTLTGMGVDASSVILTEEALTGLAFVSMGAAGEHGFAFYRNPSADMLLKPDEIDRDLISKAAIFHFGGVSLASEPAGNATLIAARFAAENGLIVSYDPNLRPALWNSPDYARVVLKAAVQYATLLKVSHSEMEFLSDAGLPPGKAARALMKEYPRLELVAVTRGDQGSLLITHSDEVFIPPVKVEAVDPTGAGDAFTAALLFYISRAVKDAKDVKDVKDKSRASLAVYRKDNLEDAGRFANAAGAIVASRPGAMTSMPDIAEITAITAARAVL